MNIVGIVFFCKITFFFRKMQEIYGKMFKGEGITEKSKENRLYCCHYQNIYILLQK